MQLRAEVAQQVRHASLDRRVDVLVVRIERERPAQDGVAHLHQRGAETLLFLGGHQPCVAKRRHVRDPCLHVLEDEPLVHLERAPERLGLLCRWLREPPGPQLAGFLLAHAPCRCFADHTLSGRPYSVT